MPPTFPAPASQRRKSTTRAPPLLSISSSSTTTMWSSRQANINPKHAKFLMYAVGTAAVVCSFQALFACEFFVFEKFEFGASDASSSGIFESIDGEARISVGLLSYQVHKVDFQSTIVVGAKEEDETSPEDERVLQGQSSTCQSFPDGLSQFGGAFQMAQICGIKAAILGTIGLLSSFVEGLRPNDLHPQWYLGVGCTFVLASVFQAFTFMVYSSDQFCVTTEDCDSGAGHMLSTIATIFFAVCAFIEFTCPLPEEPIFHSFWWYSSRNFSDMSEEHGDIESVPLKGQRPRKHKTNLSEGAIGRERSLQKTPSMSGPIISKKKRRNKSAMSTENNEEEEFDLPLNSPPSYDYGESRTDDDTNDLLFEDEYSEPSRKASSKNKSKRGRSKIKRSKSGDDAHLLGFSTSPSSITSSKRPSKPPKRSKSGDVLDEMRRSTNNNRTVDQQRSAAPSRSKSGSLLAMMKRDRSSSREALSRGRSIKNNSTSGGLQMPTRSKSRSLSSEGDVDGRKGRSSRDVDGSPKRGVKRSISSKAKQLVRGISRRPSNSSKD